MFSNHLACLLPNSIIFFVQGKPSASALHLHRCFSSTAGGSKGLVQKPPASADAGDKSDDAVTTMYQCDLCNKAFTHEKSYVQHKSVHSGLTSCPICKKILCRKYQLKVHLLKRHDITKVAVDKIAAHMRIIAKKKDVRRASLYHKVLECLQCGKRYSNPKSLELHMSMHEGKTKCHICNKVLPRTYDLKLHLKKVHDAQNL